MSLAEFCARRRKIKYKSFLPAACTSAKILPALQVWNFCALRKNYARGRVQAFSNENPAKRFSFESISKMLFLKYSYIVSYCTVCYNIAKR